MDDADGALGDGVVLVVERRYDARKVTQRRNLVSQLALRAEQADGCRGNRLQGLTLHGDPHVSEKRLCFAFESFVLKELTLGLFFSSSSVNVSRRETRNSRGLRSTQPG